MRYAVYTYTEEGEEDGTLLSTHPTMPKAVEALTAAHLDGYIVTEPDA